MADLQTLVGEPWADYGLLDSGRGRKLERYGRFRFVRPEPQAMWAPAEADWCADAEFVPGSDEAGGGRWRFDRPVSFDVQGARKFARAFPQAVLVFVLPPSGQALLERLARRSTEAPEALALRLRNALDELNAVADYHYVVVNEELDRAVAQVSAIIDAESARRDRLRALDAQIAALVRQLEDGIEQVTA